ncbi:MAG TPA: response regulator transcription factor [Chloroflexota bacterium]|nr:response regulator transcription factor [Chloroflexota bacterium]
MTEVLVIEDDEAISDLLRRGLAYEGYKVSVANDGPGGLLLARDAPPDLVVLDLMLPGLDGLEVCRRLRAAGDVPILVLTARGTVADRIAGLDSGADDYMVKPFSIDELLARVRALLRRTGPSEESVLQFADINMDTKSHEVRRGARQVHLTAKQYDLLEFFLRHPRQVLSAETIYSHVWGSTYDSNVVQVFIRNLRQALGEPDLIHTIRGAGYVLKEI